MSPLAGPSASLRASFSTSTAPGRSDPTLKSATRPTSRPRPRATSSGSATSLAASAGRTSPSSSTPRRTPDSPWPATSSPRPPSPTPRPPPTAPPATATTATTASPSSSPTAASPPSPRSSPPSSPIGSTPPVAAHLASRETTTSPVPSPSADSPLTPDRTQPNGGRSLSSFIALWTDSPTLCREADLPTTPRWGCETKKMTSFATTRARRVRSARPDPSLSSESASDDHPGALRCAALGDTQTHRKTHHVPAAAPATDSRSQRIQGEREHARPTHTIASLPPSRESQLPLPLVALSLGREGVRGSLRRSARGDARDTKLPR
mmetsp:Transcript_1804/g.5488  ORF Transcript_1804/g.5488 Transcript_1804/m.5488 type:complete len:322 (+) Transcript_1804:965-1930(+)